MQDREIEAHASLPTSAETDARPGAGGGAPDRTGRRPGACVQGATSRLFVLDTNVLIHDPTALFRFDEHDVYLPMVVLEELDAAKQGASESARNVREVGRILDEIVRDADEAAIGCGIPLPGPERTTGSGRLFLQTRSHADYLPETLPGSKPDNGILNVATALRREQPGRDVVIVSKDINLRIKARALGLHAEDYRDDVVLDDVSLLYPGVHRMPDAHWEDRIGAADSRVDDGRTLYAVDAAADEWFPNQCLYPVGAAGAGLVMRRIESGRALLEPARDYRAGGDTVWGVSARNVEQNFALNLLVDPDIDFVTLIGTAGTGKTLLALAAGLAQTLDDKRYREIVVTRVTVPVADDIGFLPGTEEEKMTPWMGALMDNLEVLTDLESGGGGWGRAATDDLLRSRIKVRSLNFMRGRTFLNRYVILDEAQNLTRHQMKTLITRAGPGTKLVCLGNVRQIDTPWLSETTSGLTHVVDRFKRWPHSGHVTLVRGERSRLADFATESL